MYVYILKNVCLLWFSQYFYQGSSFRLLFLRVDYACNRPSFLATVFLDTKVDTSSICGYSWHRSEAYGKPSMLSTYLCACPAGTFCPSGMLSDSDPLECTGVGSYCAKGSTATALCPSGHFCSSPSSRVPCPAGVVE